MLQLEQDPARGNGPLSEDNGFKGHFEIKKYL
jgi:hypothetical protein